VTNTRGIAQRNSWYKRNHSNSNIDAASWRLLGRHACSMERKHARGTHMFVHIRYLPVVRQRAPALRSRSAGRSLYPPFLPTPSLLLGRCHDACPSVLLLALASGHHLVVMRKKLHQKEAEKEERGSEGGQRPTNSRSCRSSRCLRRE
jgi:hypothetical protein